MLDNPISYVIKFNFRYFKFILLKGAHHIVAPETSHAVGAVFQEAK